MKRVLVDTSVLVSAYGRRQHEPRGEEARRLIEYLQSNPQRFELCLSPRTAAEWRDTLPASLAYTTLPYHWLDETWEQIEATWEQIGSRWGDPGEADLANKLANALPDYPRRSNIRDRGIAGDAGQGGCAYLIHENPSDFERLATELDAVGVRLVNLLDGGAEAAVKALCDC
jgi:hypothetical protein